MLKIVFFLYAKQLISIKMRQKNLFEKIKIKKYCGALSMFSDRYQKPIRYILSIVIGILCILPHDALLARHSDLRFKYLTTKDGLSQSTVKCILQDSRDFMWFGTFDGLNRYDGYEFKVYKNDITDPNSLIGNDIITIYEDNEGHLWIGTSIGLSIYDPQKDIFINNNFFNAKANVSGDISVRCIFQDSYGDMWISTHRDGLFVIKSDGKTIVHYQFDENDPNSLSSNNVRSILETSKGDIWIGTYNDGLNLYNREKDNFIHFVYNENDPNSISGNRIQSIAEDTEGNLWFACYNRGICRLKENPENEMFFTRYSHDPNNPNSLSNNLVVELCADKNAGIWIGIENGGLNFLNNDSNEFIHFKQDFNRFNSLNNNSITFIYQDKFSDLWVGTYSGGINVIHYTNQTFKKYMHIRGINNSLSHNSVWDFKEDKQNRIWIATDGGGLNVYDRDNDQFIHYNSNNTNLNNDAFLSVCLDQKEQVWVGTWGSGLNLFNKRTKSFLSFSRENNRLPDNSIFDVILDREGYLWLATLESGIIRFNPEDYSYKSYTTQNSDILYHHAEVLHEDCHGDIYIGTIFGLTVYSPDKNQFTHYQYVPSVNSTISNGFITCFFEEDSSTIWVGTMNGLNKFDKDTQTFKRYYDKDGLPSNAIEAIEIDSSGFLWISTNYGISRMNVKTEEFKNYTEADGLQGNEFIKNSSMKTRSGELLFGGVNGFVRFNPENIMENKTVPKVQFTDFLVFNEPASIGTKESTLKKHISFSEEIILSYKQSVFSFEFAALNYISSEKNQYAYMLEGFDKEWNWAGNRRRATYTNINPGEYVFKVKASNNDGVWNEEGNSIRVLITPPFWLTWWFRGILLGLLIIAILLVIQLRTLALRKQNQTLELTVSDRTKELEEAHEQLIAQERMAALGQLIATVAHEIRNPLGTIRSSVFSIGDAFKRDEEKRLYRSLELAERNVMRCDGIITELLDYTRKRQLNLHLVQFKSWIQSLVQEIDIPDDIQLNCEIEDNLTLYLDSEDMRRVFINIIENAIHAMAEENREKYLSLQARCQDDKVEIKIKDTGCGIDPDKIEKIFDPLYSSKAFGVGLGLPVVKKIIEQHQGEIMVESTLNEGTTFMLWLPINLLVENETVVAN